MVALGTPAVVDASAINTIDVAQLSSTLAIVAYAETTDVKARTITIADPPTINAEATVENGVLANSVDDEIVLIELTSTSAMIVYKNGTSGAIKARVLTVSGTTITANSPKTLSDTADNNPTSVSGCKVTSANAMVCYSSNASVGTAVILSVSGTTITENTTEPFESLPFFAGAGSTKCYAFSTTKAIVTFISDFSTTPYGNIIDISGTTLSANTAKQIDALTGGDENRETYLAGMSSTKAVLGRNAIGNTSRHWVLTLNGSDFDIGTREDLAGNGITSVLGGTAISGTKLLTAVRNSSSDLEVLELEITGIGSDELTQVDSDTLALSSLTYVRTALVDSSNVIIHYISTSSSVILASVVEALSLAAMTKPADIDAAGAFIYLALLEGGTPILTKISTDLDTDGTTVFNPGAGDNIGVECGRFNSDVIWVGGNFDGTNVVEKSENGGSSFTVKDDGTIGDVRTFVMGPDSDDRILVFDETNGDILETKDDGESWTNINTGVIPEVNDIGRLGKNVEESVFGNAGGVSNSINYSVNSGDDLEDFQTGVYPNANATKVIVN